MIVRPKVIVCFVLISLLGAAPAKGAIPSERTVERETSVQTTGQPARPIGSIDYSESGNEGRRFGPWRYDLKSRERSNGVLIYDDGSFRQKADGSDLRRQLEGAQRCTTSGNITVCK